MISLQNMNKKHLTEDDINREYKEKIKIQDYSKVPQIDGVKIWDLKNFSAEDGFLCEVARFTDSGVIETVNEFQLRQINFSKVMPGAIKAWHLHFKQFDLWYIPPDGVLSVGLADVRKSSATNGVQMKLVMGAGKSQLILIPPGVAHGYANLTNEPLYVFYFVSEQFNLNSPDERRLPWDVFGEDFWQVKPG